MALKDFSKWLSHPALQPQNMTALLVLLAQGTFVAEDILPVIPSTDDFQWLTETANDGQLLSKKRGEKGVAEVADLYDSILSGSAYEYFVKSQITAKSLRSGNIFSFVNLTVRKMQMIADKIRLTCEKDTIDALSDTSTYTTINTLSASAAWSSYASADPYKWVVKAKTAVKTSQFVDPDVLLLGAADEADMTLADSMRNSTQYTEKYTEKGQYIQRLAGLEIMVANAQYKTINTAGSYVVNKILDGKAIVLKKGMIGELREAQPYDAYSEYDKSIKTLEMYGSRVIKPIITLPQGICVVAI